MPYIKKSERGIYDEVLNQMPTIKTKGDLEYCVFKLITHFMKFREKRYSTLHEAVYSVMHCADEYRRRFLDKREDEAMTVNGDIE